MPRPLWIRQLTRRRSRIRLDVLLALALLLGYGAFLLRHISFAVGGSDSAGYANTARRLGSGTLVDRPRSLDRLGLPDDLALLCIPLGFLPGPKPGTMAPLYPPGFPAHLLGAATIAGREVGPFLVSPLAAVICVVLVFLLGRDLGLTAVTAAAAAGIFAAWPVFLFQALQPMSDVVATTWSVAAILFARLSRNRQAWALAAGVAFGMAVLVRPTNVLLAVPLLIALPRKSSRFALFAAGGVPMAAVLAAFDLHCYGGILKSGYSKLGLFDSFSLSYFPPRIKYYSLQLLQTFSPVIPVAWLALAAQRREGSRDRALLLAWFGVYLLLFSFYFPYESFIFVRFLLPGAPALVLGAALTGRLFHARWPRRAGVLSAIVVLGILAAEIRGTRRNHVFGILESQSAYPKACLWAAATLPRQSVVMAMEASGALEYYTDLSYVMWNWIDVSSFSKVETASQRQGLRWFALLFPSELESFAKQIPGRWRKIGEMRGVTLCRMEP